MTDHEGVEAAIAELPQDQQDQVRTAVLGMDVEREIASSPALNMLRTKAAEELRAARRALETVLPSDMGEIASLQAMCMAARAIERWIREAVENGNSARIALDEAEHGDGDG